MRKIVLFLLIVTLFLTGCNNSKEIKELTFAAFPSDDLAQTAKYTENISKYLEKELGIKVKFFLATDYTMVIEAMRTNKCHICILGPFSYLLASQNSGAEVVAIIGKKNGGYYSYNSLLLTNPQSGLQSIDDVRKNSANIRLVFSDPASNSGHLIPRGFLTSLGLEPEKNFKSFQFVSSHAASLLSVYNENADLSAASSESYNRLLTKPQIDSSKLVVLWRSEPLLTDPFCIKNTLPHELKERIRNAFIDMPVKDSVSFKQYIDYSFKGDQMSDSLIFMAINDSAFNSLRTIARSIKSLNIK